MTVDTTTGEIVPADHMATIEAMDPATQEVAVTNMLSEARSWLAHAIEATDPKSIANFKAQMATVAEAAKQLDLSKTIQLDAQEMVRRAERGVGVAIHKGQADGTVSDKSYGSAVRDHGLSQTVVSAKRLVPNGQELHEARTMAEADDEEFDAVIEDAKTEENLSRANVVRKVKGQRASSKTRKQKADAIAEMAQESYSSEQMAAKVGVTVATVRQIARDFGIEIPADKVLGKTRKLDHRRIVEETVHGMEGTVMALDLLDVTQIDDLSDIDYWVTSLAESTKALRKLSRQLSDLALNNKEMTQS